MRLSHIRAESPRELVPVLASAEAFRHQPATPTKRDRLDRRISHAPVDATRARRASRLVARGQVYAQRFVPQSVGPAAPVTGDRSQTAFGCPRLARPHLAG